MLEVAHLLQELGFFEVNCHSPREKLAADVQVIPLLRTPSHIIPDSRQPRSLHCCNVTSPFLWQPTKKPALSLTIVLPVPLSVLQASELSFPWLQWELPAHASQATEKPTVRLTESAHKFFKSSMLEFPKVQYFKYFHCAETLIFLISAQVRKNIKKRERSWRVGIQSPSLIFF